MRQYIYMLAILQELEQQYECRSSEMRWCQKVKDYKMADKTGLFLVVI